MSLDHAFDDLYDLDDLLSSDAWFDSAAAGRLDDNDPLGHTVNALLGRLDREVANLAPLEPATEAAVLTSLRERTNAVSTPATRHRQGRNHVSRSIIVLGITTTLITGIAGVAAASPGSWLYPVRQVATGQSGSSTPEDLATAAHILDLVEVDIEAAQRAGGIDDVTRRDLAARLGVIHDVVESGGGEVADGLLSRWNRDDLVLIALPRIGDSATSSTNGPTPSDAQPATPPTAPPAGSPVVSAPTSTATAGDGNQPIPDAPDVVAKPPETNGEDGSPDSASHSARPSPTPEPSHTTDAGSDHQPRTTETGPAVSTSPSPRGKQGPTPSSTPSTGAMPDD